MDRTNTYTYGFNRIAQVSETQTGYFLGDALGSVRQVVDPQAEVLLAQSYSPYGETLSSVGDYETAYSYTGEMTDGTGLVNLRTRYYDPGTGRFVSRDTWGGNYNRSLSLNRWSYVEGNPIVRNDPSGHCYGPLSFLRNVPVEREICESLDQALVIYVWPGSSSAELTLASAYIGGWAFGHSALIVGAAGLTLAKGIELTTWLIARYELNPAIQQATNQICDRSKIWSLKPFQRGIDIENLLGRSPEFVSNFPVIDKWNNGIATSIKSIDLTANSYQNISTLTNKVQSYVTAIANWQGVRWGGVSITSDQIISRELLLAIPPTASQAQLAALSQIQTWAQSKGVELIIQVIP